MNPKDKAEAIFTDAFGDFTQDGEVTKTHTTVLGNRELLQLVVLDDTHELRVKRSGTGLTISATPKK